MKLTMNVIFTERELAPLETYKTFHSPKKHLSFLENTPKNERQVEKGTKISFNESVDSSVSKSAGAGEEGEKR